MNMQTNDENACINHRSRIERALDWRQKFIWAINAVTKTFSFSDEGIYRVQPREQIKLEN